jgi:hypothetical protein
MSDKINNDAPGVRIYGARLPQREESMRVAAPLILGLALVTGATGARATPTVWQGVAVISSIGSVCPSRSNGQIAVDNSYTVFYRPNLMGGQGSERLIFNGSVGTELFETANFRSFQGRGTFSSTTIFLNAVESLTSTGSYNLSIQGVPSQFITIIGTLRNFFDFTGCTVTFSAALTQRP